MFTCNSRFDSRPMPFLNRPHKRYSTTKFQVCCMASNFKPFYSKIVIKIMNGNLSVQYQIYLSFVGFFLILFFSYHSTLIFFPFFFSKKNNWIFDFCLLSFSLFCFLMIIWHWSNMVFRICSYKFILYRNMYTNLCILLNTSCLTGWK